MTIRGEIVRSALACGEVTKDTLKRFSQDSFFWTYSCWLLTRNVGAVREPPLRPIFPICILPEGGKRVAFYNGYTVANISITITDNDSLTRDDDDDDMEQNRDEFYKCTMPQWIICETSTERSIGAIRLTFTQIWPSQLILSQPI